MKKGGQPVGRTLLMLYFISLSLSFVSVVKICENMSPLGWPASLASSSEEWTVGSMLGQTVSDPLDTWHIIIFQNVLLLNFPRSKFATDSDPEYPLETSVSESRNNSILVYCYTWHVWHIIIFQIVFLLNFPSLPPLLASIQLRRSQHFNEEILQILKCWFL